MHYHVTLLSSAFGLVTYDVEGATEEDAKTKAASLFLKKRSRFGLRDFTIVKVVETGVSAPRKRRIRRKPASAPLARGANAANAP